MRELTREETQEEALIGLNEQLRVRYQQEVHFHAIIVCYDTTDDSTYTAAVKLYKDLITNVVDAKKVSRFARVPVAFVGTKLDLTDFLKSDMSAVPRCIKVVDLRAWLAKVHKRADNACFEISAKENIGISIMMDWVVKAALRAH